MKTIYLEGWVPRSCFNDKEIWDDLNDAMPIAVYKNKGEEEDYTPENWPPIKVNIEIESTEACFDEKPDDIGDLLTVEDWMNRCESGGFIDYDGFGHPIKDGKMCGHTVIYPSIREKIPEGTTHIMWYNR